MAIKLCPPALIYVVFSMTQIIIDTIKGLYNTALMKFIVMAMCTLLLNALCENGMSVISWIIVFIPFILMTVVVSMLLYIFGLDIATGSFNYNSTSNPATNSITTNSITTNSITTNSNTNPTGVSLAAPTLYSSSPAMQSGKR